MWFLYILIIAIAVTSIVLNFRVRKQIAEIHSEEEKRAIKAKWQLVFGLLGVAMIIVAGIMIFTMF